MENQPEKIIEVAPIESTIKRIPPDQNNPMIRKRNSLGYYLTLGIRGLLGSKKGSFSMIIFAFTTAALFLGKISGSEFVAGITVIAGIYNFTATATDIQNMRNQ